MTAMIHRKFGIVEAFSEEFWEDYSAEFAVSHVRNQIILEVYGQTGISVPPSDVVLCEPERLAAPVHETSWQRFVRRLRRRPTPFRFYYELRASVVVWVPVSLVDLPHVSLPVIAPPPGGLYLPGVA